MGYFDFIVRSHQGFVLFTSRGVVLVNTTSKLVVFSALFVEQVVAIWSVITEDICTETLTAPP